MHAIHMFKSILKTIFRSRRGESKSRLSLLRKMPKNSVCAEIGVWKGDFSHYILVTTSPETLHLIDPWEYQSEYPDRMYGGSVARSQSDMDLIYEGVKERFGQYQNVVFNKGKSETVLKDFPDQYFDWVYIDGNHYYDHVMQDLTMCLCKVKKGGVIAGDDYKWQPAEGQFPVKQAVHDFVKSHGLQDRLTIIGSQYMIEI